jgi:23S rRNA pseudouridine955/2504/2580 synthase
MKGIPITMTAAADDDGRRLDRILRKALPDLPLSRLHRLLRKGGVLVNNLPGKAADRVMAGQVITIFSGSAGMADRIPPTSGEPPDAAKAVITPRTDDVPPALDILWEGPDLLAVNKPSGIAAHGPESLETRVQAYLAGKLPPSLSFRPGPLHRLDKPTSGIMVFSKTLEGARYFSALIREGGLIKRYLALVSGVLDKPEVWEGSLIRDTQQGKTFTVPPETAGAKNARTRVKALSSIRGITLIMAEIETGRTHQIRAQAAAHGHPLLGDRKYGGPFLPGGFLLHAYSLEGPGDRLPPLITAPLPALFQKKIGELFGDNILRTMD